MNQKKSKKTKGKESVAEKILGPTGRTFVQEEDFRTEKREDEKYALADIEIYAQDIKIWEGKMNLTLEEVKIVDIMEMLETTVQVKDQQGLCLIEICHNTGHTSIDASLKRDKRGFLRNASDIEKEKKCPLESFYEIRLPARLEHLLDPKKNQNEESPLDTFWTCILKLKQLPPRPEGTKLNISAIYMHINEYEILEDALKKWALATYKKTTDDKIAQAVTWALVDCAPNVFENSKEADQCKPNCIYIRKTEDLWIYDAGEQATLAAHSVLVDDRIPQTADGHTLH